MLVNFVLDFYRPRTAGGAARAVYDSRLSGLLAEPQGLFRTFAHTMDYQFGFRISETWFFRFLERAFLPLVLVWAVTLYALGSLVVVRPGEAAVIERWGAPRGMTAVPSDSAGWDAAPRPLGPGLHLKWPWPVETVRLLPRGRTRTVFVGFRVRSGEEADAKARELSRKVVSWDAEHVEDEIKYLRPMPETMEEAPPLAPPGAPEAEAAPPAPVRPAGGAVEEGPRPEGVAGATGRRPALVAAADLPDVLFLSGLFSLEWRVGPAPGDVYRYLYRMRDPEATLRLLFEREVTAYTAGANFWDLLAGEPEHAKERIFRRLREETARLGLGVELVALNIQNVHPPVGEVGKAYQAVLGAREQREALLYGGEVEAIRIEGLVESVFNEKVTEAEAYRHRRVAVSEAEAARFEQQRSADRAAPRVYRHREATAALEAGLAGARKVLVPEGVTVILDDTKILRPTGVEQALVREAAREQAR
jgi:regulator of protease activity HflC (stomatin/prohibitin superfamily)